MAINSEQSLNWSDASVVHVQKYFVNALSALL